jgi:hypothetical protein
MPERCRRRALEELALSGADPIGQQSVGREDIAPGEEEGNGHEQLGAAEHQ